MSYPGVDPDETVMTNPVGTQEVSSGNPELEAEVQRRLKQVIETGVPYQEPSVSSVKNEVHKAVSDMFAPTDAWQGKEEKVQFKHEFPSGQTALIQYLGTMDLVEYGLVEELDFFTRKLFPANIDQSGNPVEAEEKSETLLQSLSDPEKRARFLDLTGKLLAAASIRPSIVHDGVIVREDEEGKQKVVFGYQAINWPIDEQVKFFGAPIARKKDGQVYSGPIGFEDRMSLFHALNQPLRQIEPFRDEPATVLPDLAGVEGNGGSAE